MVLYTYFFNLIDIRALSGKRQPDYQLKRRASKGPVTRNQRSFPTTRTLLSQHPGTFVPSSAPEASSLWSGSLAVTLVGHLGCHTADGTSVHAADPSGMGFPTERRRNPCRRPFRHGSLGVGSPKPMPKPAPAWACAINRETGEVTDRPGNLSRAVEVQAIARRSFHGWKSTRKAFSG